MVRGNPARGWNSQDAPSTKLNSGKKKGQSGGIIQKCELHERNPCALSSEEQPPEETWGQAGCTSKVAWNLARKYASSKPNVQLRFILLWMRQRHRRWYVYCVFGSFNAQCWTRRFELRYNGYFETVQKPHMRLTATGDSANKRACTSFCSWSQSVHNSAIARWSAGDPIASKALLKTRKFIWVESCETTQSAKNGKSITCTMDNLAPVVASRLSLIPAAFCLEHRD